MTLLQLAAFASWERAISFEENSFAIQLREEVFAKGRPTVGRVRRIAKQYPHPITRRTICLVETVKIKRIGIVEIGQILESQRPKRFRCPICRRTNLPRHTDVLYTMPCRYVCVVCAQTETTVGSQALALLRSFRFWGWPLPYPNIFV